MNIGELCQRNVVTVRRSDELTAAAQLMREKHVGYLVVVDFEPTAATHDLLPIPVGVLTDRDIVVAVLARDADLRSLRVGDVMTRQPVTAVDTDSVSTALREMRRIGVRRLPVVGRRGELVGVLSLDDAFDELASQLQDIASSIRNEQRVERRLRP